MYQVSQDYMTKAFNISKKRRAIRAFLDDVAFNENDVVSNTLKYTWQAVGGADINLGGVFLGQLWLTFTKPFAAQIQRGSWKGKKITLEIGLEIGIDENQIGTEIVNGEEIPVYEYVPIIEYVPIGEYFIEEANHTMDGVEITAYDAMRKFDKNLNLSSTSGSLYSLLTFACENCEVTLGMTKAEIEALPNGTEAFSIYPENDMKTYRDLISWIGVTACCFATMSRAGELVLRGWKSASLLSMGVNDRFERGSWSDFHTFYTGISVTNIAEMTTSYYHTSPDNGLTMNVGANPLLQYGLDDTKRRQRMAILEGLEYFNYVPFKVSAFADVFIDLGDIITFTDGLAGTASKGCVMRIDFTFAKGITMQGFGENPALFGAQSKTDKNIEGLMAKNNENQISFITYTNAERINLTYKDSDGLQSSPIATFHISPIKDTNLDVNTRVIYDDIFTAGSTEQYVKAIKAIRYEMDGNVVARVPYEDNPFCIVDNRLLGQERNNTIEDYQPLLNVKAGDRKTLIVYLEYEVQGTATDQEMTSTIDIGGITITLKGQGLPLGESWDGIIYASDEIPYIPISGIGFGHIEEDVSVDLLDVIPLDLEDDVPSVPVVGLDALPMTESISITMVRPTFNISSESGEANLVTEDGDSNIITE